jgi:prevent-host-death family protein
MGHKVYSIYQAKARFSEIIRIVRRRRRVIITDRGIPVAEVVPYEADQQESIEGRIAKLAQIGAIIPSQEPFRAKPVRLVPGAGDRFMAQDRD